MANYRAVEAVAEAVIELLESQYDPADFDGNQLEFDVYLAKNFEQPMKAGVSFFLYRIYANSTNRTPPGRLDQNGQRHRTQLPLDLHFLLSAWAQDASLQHAIAGWMMRILEDTPNLPAGLLNKRVPEIFHFDETVEIVLAELTTEELFRIWEVIGNNSYQISVPYVARNVKIETKLLQTTALPAQLRTFEVAKPGEP